MVRDIVNGIAKALSEEFGDEYTIYADKVEQGLKQKCFIIKGLEDTYEPIPLNKYYQSHPFTIQYIKQDGESWQDVQDIGERMGECLECIEFCKGYHYGYDMHTSYNDEVFTFFVSYNFYVRMQYEKDKMIDIENNTSVRSESDE